MEYEELGHERMRKIIPLVVGMMAWKGREKIPVVACQTYFKL